MKYPPVQNFIGGKFVSAVTARKLSVVSPIDGTVLSEVPMSSNANLDNAIRAAKTAFPGWSKTSIKERIQVFFKYKTLLEKNLQEPAELSSEENGKTIGESIAEIEKCIELTEIAFWLGVPVPREPFSFGRWNESRFGVEDITGKSSIEFWTKLKKSTVNCNSEVGVNWMS